MAGLINRRGLGTQPQPVSVQRGGGHQNRLHRRGGGGGGGGGNNRIPRSGLYHGRQGRLAANQNPEAFFRSAVSGVGGLNYAGTPIAEFSQDFVAKLLDDYNMALAGNQRLDPTKFLRQTTGAGWGGKKSRTFQPGNLGLGGGALESAYTDWYSNTMPNDFLTGRLTGQGGFVPGGGNQAYQEFAQTNFAPGVLAEVAAGREANPHLSVADLIAGRDLAGEARRRFLARPNAMRQISPANASGRWSWWE